MTIVEITEPRSVAYPFAQALYEDPLVTYHGTSSAYIEGIESDGLRCGSPSFDRAGIDVIIESYAAIGLAHWDVTALKAYAVGSAPHQTPVRAIYLSQTYWRARDYASNLGGEAANNVLNAAANFRQFVADTERRVLLAKHHKNQAQLAEEQGRPAYATRPRLQAERLQDEAYLHTSVSRVEAVERALRQKLKGSHPLVYAVRVEREWFDDWEDPEKGDKFCFVDINLKCKHPIPRSHLLAKANYVNGLVGDSLVYSHLPMDWNTASSLGSK